MDDDETTRAILTAASRQDPSIEVKTGALIARACQQVLAAEPGSEPAEVARRVLARFPDADPSWTAHLARAAVSIGP